MNPRGLACPARFERATYALEGRCSIQLSYGQSLKLSKDYNGGLDCELIMNQRDAFDSLK